MVTVKILSLGDAERYALRRLVVSAQQELQSQTPDLQMEIQESNDAGEIGKYATTLVLPTLLIDGKVVCTGRFPSREEVLGWLKELV